MSEETTTTETTADDAPDGAGDQGGERDNAPARRDARRRAEAVARAKEAEKRLADLEAAAEEKEAKLEEAQRKSGELDKVLARKDSIIEKLTRERDEAIGERENLLKGWRTGTLVDRLAEETKLPKGRVKGMLLAMQSDNPDEDIAPDKVDDFVIKSWKKKLAAFDPASFQTTTEQGGPRPRPVPAPAEHLRGLGDGERPAADALGALMQSQVFQPPKDGRPM